MADIPSVSSQIQQLESSYDLWNSIALWLTAATAVLAVFYFGASRMANREAKKLDEARKQESQLKEEQRQKEKEESDRQIQGLKNENVTLGIQFEKERQARLLIERRLAPRFLSTEAEKIIAEAIRPYSGHQVAISGNGDPEAELYADQFVRLFESVKWKVARGTGALMGTPQYGIFVGISRNPDQAVQAVMSGLKNAGIKFQSRIAPHFAPENITLDVKLKETLSTP